VSRSDNIHEYTGTTSRKRLTVSGCVCNLTGPGKPRRRTRVNTNSEQDLLVPDVSDLEAEDMGQEVQGQCGDVSSVQVAIRGGEAAGHHIVVGDGLHFVHIVLLDDGVEAGVEVVQNVHHLSGTPNKC